MVRTHPTAGALVGAAVLVLVGAGVAGASAPAAGIAGKGPDVTVAGTHTIKNEFNGECLTEPSSPGMLRTRPCAEAGLAAWWDISKVTSLWEPDSLKIRGHQNGRCASVFTNWPLKCSADQADNAGWDVERQADGSYRIVGVERDDRGNQLCLTLRSDNAAISDDCVSLSGAGDWNAEQRRRQSWGIGS
ncbi:hypothetical protein G3I40_20585 [Streptomyces sp. SID14478]|uniref:hypothetical protein n=1 Tax=Streptomyces sp. SID14478 TaxID=2706073 RepID=UPI0013D9233E|nr:hypothetical protein [Streptomyces sp. SID14478]NEB77591.1 hypothetical protein [Streptomyces sp. SID14478]